MRVRIEREVCTGAGDCARAVPDVFWIADDALAMVKEEAAHFGETRRFDGPDEVATGFTPWARVPESLEAAVEQAAADCPGTCILIERPAPEPEPEPVVEDEWVEEPAAPAAPPSFLRRVKRRLGRLLR